MLTNFTYSNNQAPILASSDFYNSQSVLHPITVGGITLTVVFVWLRLSSARSLNPTTIYSYVCSIALGSTISRIITQPELNLVRGLLSIFMIAFFEWFTTLLVSHVTRPFAYIFKTPPVLLVFRGKVNREKARSYRISPSGIMQALRTKGLVTLEQAEAVVLEANGQFSVIPRIYDEHLLNSEMEALTSVPGYSERCAEANRAKHHREPWLPTWTKLDQEKASQQQHQYDTPNGQWQQ